MNRAIKKSVAIILAMLMVLTATPLAGFASETRATEHLTEVPDGYIGIYTIEDLYCVRNDLTSNYILMNDIDLSEATAEGGDWNFSGRGWNPIGSDDKYSNLAFSGIFDGNNYSITGMNINITDFPSETSGRKYIGLFAYVTGSVKNLLVDGEITLKHTSSNRYDIHIGGIAAYAKGSNTYAIENCISSVDINVDKSWIHNPNYSYTTVDMILTIGGIVGQGYYLTPCKVKNCINLGKISVVTNTTLFPHTVYCSGIVGRAGMSADTSNSATVENCINTADISLNLSSTAITNYGYVSGIAFSGQIYNSYNNANLTATKNKGYAYAAGISSEATCIDSCYNIGTVSGQSATYAIGSTSNKPTNKSYYLSGIGNNGVSYFTELTNAQMKLQSMYSGWDFDTVWTMEGRDDYPYPELQSVELIFPGEDFAHEHSYSVTVTTPATHLTEGVITYTCDCGDTYTETIAKTPAHTYAWFVTTPTCTEQGFTTYTCECGDTYFADEVAALGHDYKTVVTAPTCTEQGYTTYTCTCGDSYVADYVDALDHDYKAVVTAPTCTEQGYTTYTCECGDTYFADEVAALGHDYKTVVTAPTCTEQGFTTYTCACGDSYVDDYTDVLDHDYKAVVTAPTCTEQGFTTYTCECGDAYVSDYVEANGHNHTATVTTPATHLAEGVMTYTCHCGDTYTETIAKTTDHTYATVVTAPTCTEQGFTTYTCDCGDVYIADYVEENGHKHTAIVTTPATHLAEGVMTYTCNCGDTYTETIAKTTEHTYTSVVTAPTCTEQGYTTYTCTCGDSYVADYVDALDHDYKTVVTAPTCTAQGFTTYTCSCGDTYVDNYTAAKGHTEKTVPAVAPTCTKEGLTEGVICADCSMVLVAQKKVAKLDHVDEDTDNKCDSCGTKVRSCDCMCHATDSFNRFFYKLIQFFRNLFGIYSECKCGIVHK